MAAADGELAVQNVEALILTVMHMQRRLAADADLKDAQGTAGGVPRRLQAGISCQAGASRNHIPSQEVSHGYMITPVPQRGHAPAGA